MASDNRRRILIRIFKVFKSSPVSIVLIVLSCVLVQSALGIQLDLFSEKDRHGLSIRLEVSDEECSNMPPPWTNRAKSLNTLGSCLQFYDELGCKGSLTVIQPFHTIHQMDMSLINFANRIQSSSPCGAKIKTGRYVIQNAADATVLSVASKYGGFARAQTVKTSKVIPKNQQWEIIEIGNSDYTLRPREHADNYPVSFDEESLKSGKIKKKMWKLMSVGRGRYLIKNEPTQKCLYKTDEGKVEEHDCRIWSPNQEWVFRSIFSDQKAEKNKGASVGPGLNFNILSKVASYQPPSKPLPQISPIFVNVSTLASMKRVTTAAPYTIRKKIKRGPRPKNRPIDFLQMIRPPGLYTRPAISPQIANNNNFLLMTHPGIPNKAIIRPEFIPSDDRPEPFDYYQILLQAHAAQSQVPVPPKTPQDKKPALEEPAKKKKKKKSKDTEEEDEDAQDDDDASEDDDGSEEDEEEPFDDTARPHISLSNHNNNTNGGNPEDEYSPGFFRKVFSRVKSGIGSVASMNVVSNIPFISKKNESSGSAGESSRQPHPHPNDSFQGPPSSSSFNDNNNLPLTRPYTRPHRTKKGHHPKRHPGHQKPGTKNNNNKGPGLRQPKRPPKSTTTTTTPKSSWLFFG